MSSWPDPILIARFSTERVRELEHQLASAEYVNGELKRKLAEQRDRETELAEAALRKHDLSDQRKRKNLITLAGFLIAAGRISESAVRQYLENGEDHAEAVALGREMKEEEKAGRTTDRHRFCARCGKAKSRKGMWCEKCLLEKVSPPIYLGPERNPVQVRHLAGEAGKSTGKDRKHIDVGNGENANGCWDNMVRVMEDNSQ